MSVATSEFDNEVFGRLFDAALAEAHRAAKLGDARDQVPLVAVDRYVERMIEEIETLRAYRDTVNKWLACYPSPPPTSEIVSIGGRVILNADGTQTIRREIGYDILNRKYTSDDNGKTWVKVGE